MRTPSESTNVDLAPTAVFGFVIGVDASYTPLSHRYGEVLMTRPGFGLALVMLAVVLVSGPARAADGSLDRVKKAGVLVVGSTPSGPPFTFLNTETNRIEGIMVDIAANLAAKLGVKVEAVDTKWAALIPTLQSGRTDAIAAAMYITPKRQEVINFTDPIFGWGEHLVVHKNSADITSLESLKGRVVGVQVGTAYIDLLKDKWGIKELKIYDTIGDMITELDNGRLDAFAADRPIVLYLMKKNPTRQVKLVEGYRAAAEPPTGLGLRKSDEDLREALNAAIATMKASGELKTILTKWGL